MNTAVAKRVVTQARATVPGRRFTAALLFAVAALAVGSFAVAYGRGVRDDATAESALTFHLRASQRAQDDARRCSRDLLALAAQHPAVAARALEIDGAAIAAAGRPAELALVTAHAIETSVATVEHAVAYLASPGAAGVNVALQGVGDATARAHRGADRLCEARQAVSAATLTPLAARERLNSM